MENINIGYETLMQYDLLDQEVEGSGAFSLNIQSSQIALEVAQYEPRSFDSQDVINLKDDPDDHTSLLDFEKEILELAKVEESRFSDNQDEIAVAEVMTHKPGTSATSTITSGALYRENSDKKKEDPVDTHPVEFVEVEKASKKKYPVTPPVKRLISQAEYRKQQKALSQIQKVISEESGGSTPMLPAIRKRKAEDEKTPTATANGETKVKKKKVSLGVAPPLSDAPRQTRASKRKTEGGDLSPIAKKSKRKTAD